MASLFSKSTRFARAALAACLALAIVTTHAGDSAVSGWLNWRGPHQNGTSDETNLWLSCPLCNRYKADQTHALDPQTGETVPLFNPRSERWDDHFAWQDTLLIGLTAVGRATIRVLNINDEERQRVRLAAGQ